MRPIPTIQFFDSLLYNDTTCTKVFAIPFPASKQDPENKLENYYLFGYYAGLIGWVNKQDTVVYKGRFVK